MNLSKIGVIGAGTMGNGIAQVSAAAGLEVVMVDVSQAALDRGLAAIGGSLDRLVKKQKLSADGQAAVRSRIRGSTQYRDLAAADLVIEAATENPEVKRKIMRQADEIMRPEAILATNTSSISITAIAAATTRADRVVGMHFFNPVPVMALVELIRGLLPFKAFALNEVWLEIVMLAHDLIVWTQALVLDGELAKSEPKRLRYRLLHVAARLAFSGRRGKLHLPQAWPWTEALKAAFEKLKTLPATTG